MLENSLVEIGMDDEMADQWGVPSGTYIGYVTEVIDRNISKVYVCSKKQYPAILLLPNEFLIPVRSGAYMRKE